MHRYINVIDNEPSTVIAYALSSLAYGAKLTELFTTHYAPVFAELGETASAATTSSGTRGEERAARGELSTPQIDALLASRRTDHYEQRFADEFFEAKCVMYYPVQFHALRTQYVSEMDQFLMSLSRCRGWKTSGGKSNASFAKTLDDRLVLKGISKSELDSFLGLGPEYFSFVSNFLFGKNDERENDSSGASPSTLCMLILGVFQIEVTLLKRRRERFRQTFIVMENLFYDAPEISARFDLKGSERSRFVTPSPEAKDQVLQDDNFKEFLSRYPLYVGESDLALLSSSVVADSRFLARCKVMDYSLLLGIDYSTATMYCGVIDYIRQYTWDKQVESIIKSSGLMGGGGKAPTVVMPEQYKDRFRAAMRTYFTLVPDKHSTFV